jgi:hypothetical protein
MFVLAQWVILLAIQVPLLFIAKAGAWGSDPHTPATSPNRFWTGMVLNPDLMILF